MKSPRLIIFVLACSAFVNAQEREVPKDSARISIPGCARGRTFIVGTRADEPVRSDVAPGRRFRLSGPKAILDQIKKQESNMVEVTGLVRKSQLAGPGGVSTAGGRVRIGGGDPRQALGDPGRDVGYNEAVLDLESWRPLPEACKAR
jgi:hypothetical protein